MLAGGIATGEVCVVGARPSHGKTMFGLQWCFEVSKRFPCLVISEEMTAMMLTQRMTMTATEHFDTEWQRLHQQVFNDVVAFAKPRRPVLIAEDCRTADRAAQAIAEAKQHHGIKLAVVDYVQLLRAPGGSKYEQVSEVSQTLKAAAVENDVALVVLAQLSRASEKEGTTFAPKMHHLKDSGQIEQDADVVIFLCWPWKIDPKESPEKYAIFGAKNRNRGIRGTGVVELRINPRRQMISMPDVYQQAESASNYEPTFAAYNNEEFI